MCNPYPRPMAGGYKQPIIDGLIKLNRLEEAKLFQDGLIKLGIRNTFTGNVRTNLNLSMLCVDALKVVEQTDAVKYYLIELGEDRIAACYTEGAFVYDWNNLADAKKAKELANDNEIIQPFFS